MTSKNADYIDPAAETGHAVPTAHAEDNQHPSTPETKAVTIREAAAAIYAHASSHNLVQKVCELEPFRRYLEDLYAQSGQTNDPVERMMLEQLALAYHNIGSLHIQAAQANTVQTTVALSNAATRLLGEYRRLTLALQAYRAPAVAARPPETVQRTDSYSDEVTQKNQQDDIPSNGTPHGPENGHKSNGHACRKKGPSKKSPDTEQGSNGADGYALPKNRIAESAPSSSREEERAEAVGAHA